MKMKDKHLRMLVDDFVDGYVQINPDTKLEEHEIYKAVESRIRAAVIITEEMEQENGTRKN